MKYWVFQNNQVTGPYHPDDLTQVPGYSGETLVCPEGRRGTNMGDWQRASMVPELSLSIIKAGQLAVALKGSGGYGSLPPEPTLKDLAALGSLQEKVSLLDNTVGHLQESLRLKDEELLSVHQELDDKTKYAQELSVKLGGLEERFTAVNQLRENLDKAVEAEHETEGVVEKQARLIEDLSTQLKALRDEQRQMDELRAELGALKQKQEAERQETERKLAEAKQAADDAAKQAAEAQTQAKEAASRPMPSAPLGGQNLGGPSLGAPAPMGLKPDASPAERLGLPTERPSAAPLNLDAPAPLAPLGEVKPPMDPLGGAPAGLSPLGEAKPLDPLGGGFDPNSFMAVPPAAEAAAPAAAPSVVPEAPAAAPAKSKKPLVLVGVAVIAVAALGAVKLGLVGGKKAAPVEMPAAPVADRMPLPPPAAEIPKTPTPEELAEQEKQAAIGMVKMQPLPNGTMVGPVLEAAVPAAGGLSPWMADKGKDGKYQVNFYSPKTDNGPALTYEFDVALADRKVSAHNKNAQALMTGKPVEAETPKKVAKSGKPRMPRIKPKKAAAPADDTGLLQDLLSVDDNPAPKKKAAASKKAAATEAPAEGDGGGDIMIDGSGHDAQPQEIAAKPIRKAPKRAAEKRNVDKELNDLLSDDGSAPAKKAAPPKEESLDELLAPGGARPGDAAPVAEPSAQPAEAADAAPAPRAEAPADADMPAPDEQASAPAPKKAGKAPKKKQPADAELLDDLLK